MQGIIDELSRQAGNIYRQDKDHTNQRLMQNRAISADEKKQEERQNHEILVKELEDSLANVNKESDFIRMMTELDRRDSSNLVTRIADREQDRKDRAQDFEAVSKRMIAEMDRKFKLDSLTRANLKKEEEDKARRNYSSFAGVVRRNLSPFLSEEGGLMNFGLNESQMYSNWFDNFDALNQLVVDIDEKKIPKGNPERQKTERLLLDLHNKIRSFDYKKDRAFYEEASGPTPRQKISPSNQGIMPSGEWEKYNDFMDGGFALDSGANSESQMLEAQTIYDDLTTMMLRLGIPIPKKSLNK